MIDKKWSSWGVLFFSVFLFLISLEPVMAAAGGIEIEVGQPRRDGTVTVEIECQKANGQIETTQVTVKISEDFTPNMKAREIDIALDQERSRCFTSWLDRKSVEIRPRAGAALIKAGIVQDNTAEGLGLSPYDFLPPWFWHFGFVGVSEGGVIHLMLGAEISIEIETIPGMGAEAVTEALYVALLDQGVAVELIAGDVYVQGMEVDEPRLYIDTNDLGLDTHLLFESMHDGCSIVDNNGEETNC